MRTLRCAWMVVVLGAASVFAQTGSAQSGPVRISGFSLVETLAVDATDAPRKVFHARMTIPATPGDFVLLYPKWIPGEHSPTGPVVDTAGIYFRANGQALNWHRDPVDMYAYHVDVPPGVSSIEATLDYLSPVEAPGNFSAGIFGNREACSALLELDGSLSEGVRLGRDRGQRVAEATGELALGERAAACLRSRWRRLSLRRRR